MQTVGVDEAGRGALAGPIVVAAVAIPTHFYPRRVTLPRLRDSKKLSFSQREVWFRYIKEHPKIFYATARVYPRIIERKNIAYSANLASTRALLRLINDLGPIRESDCRILLDGSLYLVTGNEKLSAKTIIRGDEKFVAIKLASIIAKVVRDNYMIRLHQKYPGYNFNLHKGYGTTLHFRKLKKHGLNETHRLTYLRKWPRLRSANLKF